MIFREPVRKASSRFALLLSLAALLPVLFASPVDANEAGVGTSGAAFLRITPMARPLGMGSAYTGLAEGIEALHFNPAGISSVDKWDVGLAHVLYPLDATFSYLAVARRVSPKSVAALHLSYLGTEDEFRNSNGVATGVFSNFDMALAGSISYDLSNEVSAGGTIRTIFSELGGYKASAVGFDLGVKYKPLRWKGVSVGASIKNAGTGLKYISVSSPQPLQLKLGGAWEPVSGRYVLSGDVSWDREAQPRVNLGGEYRVTRQFMLRGGFDIGYNSNIERALKLGMGFNSHVGSFDYAYESQEEVGNAHRFSYSYRGGRPQRTEEREESTDFLRQLDFTNAPRTVGVAVLPFLNLSPRPDYDWLTEGFRSIFLDRFAKDRNIVISPRREARYLIEGRYSVLANGDIWVGVKVLDSRTGELAGFQEATIQESDLIRTSGTLAGAVIANIPVR